MKTAEIKNNFHRLIDRIDDASLLLKFYSMLQKASDNYPGHSWNLLSQEQEELLRIERETDDEENLVPHAEVSQKNRKYL